MDRSEYGRVAGSFQNGGVVPRAGFEPEKVGDVTRRPKTAKLYLKTY